MKKNLLLSFTIGIIILLSAAFSKTQAQTITAGTATGSISAYVGTASASPNIQQFTVTGSSLTGSITATAPTGFELSLAAGSGYGSNVTLPQSGGVVNNTVIYVRSAATALAGSISGNVALSSTGATSRNVAVTGRINALPVVAPIINQTLINGDTTAAINFTGTGNTFTWVNDTPGIGLAASGTGDIAAFTAINTSFSPVTATITVTPRLAPLAYVANGQDDNTVSVINTITNKVIATIPVGTTPFNVAVSPDNSKVYVTNNHSNSVSVINTATNTVTATIDLHVLGQPAAVTVSPDGNKVYVGYLGGNTITVINAATNTISSTITLTGYTSGLALSPDGSRLYVTDGSGITKGISIINTATNAVTGIISAGSAQAIILSPDGSKIYALNYNSNTVSVIDASTNVVTTTIPVGTNPWAVALSPDGSILYVTNSHSNSISIISTATNIVTATIPAGLNPFGISATQDGRFLYVENPGNNNVLVINASTHAIVTTIPVGESPISFGNFIAGGTGSAGVPVTFTITVNPTTPTIQAGTATGFISACAGTASLNTQQFNVTGISLSANIIAIAPTGFEISLTAGSGYSSSVTLTQLGGVISNTIVYVRSSATAPAGTISGTIVLTSTGATSQNVAVKGTINALLTVNPVSNQTISNSTASAAINFTGTGDTFNWVNDTPGIGLATSGTGNIPSFVAINTGNSPVKATIIATPSHAGFAYIANSNSNTISVISTTSNTLVTTITVGTGPIGVSVNRDGSRVYVANNVSNSVSVIDASTNTVIATIAVGPSPTSISVSPDGSRVYVVNGDSSISVIDTSSNTVAAAYSIPGSLHALSISPDGNQLYVVSNNGDILSVINAATGLVTATIGLPASPGLEIAVSPDGSRVYLPSYSTNSVMVVNTITNSLMASIPAGTRPFANVVSTDGNRLYVANNGSNTISVINTKTNTLITTIPVGNTPYGISVSPDGKLLYVVNNNSNNIADISVINTANNTVIATVATGQASQTIGNFVSAGNGCAGIPTSFTITVTPPNNATLSSLILNPGSALFQTSGPGNVNYTTAVDPLVNTVTLTPTAKDPSATITVNGVPVISGSASAPIPLNSGPTLITTVVTAADGITTKTYTVTVNRTGSNNGALSSLTINTGSGLILTNSTTSTVNYSTSVDPSVSTVTFTPTAVEAGSTITINGVAVNSGSASGTITLNSGPTIINAVVTAPDGVTTKTYSVKVIRASNNATLSTLILNPPAAMFPISGPAGVNYTTAVDPGVSSVTITPTTQDVNATVTVNGVPVSSGAASGAITLNSGPTLITTVVTAQDGITTKTYNVTVNRTGSNNGTLSSLVMNPGSTLFLTSANTTAVNYTTSVEPTVNSVTFTPTVQQAGATVTVNGVAVSNGSASGPILLNSSGPTIIPTVVTAPDGVTTKSYYVTVNKVGSNNARLVSLVLNPHSALALVSSTPAKVEYTTVVADTVGTVTLTAITSDPNATFTINGTNASPATITLNVGDNLITTVVTAHDGVTTKTYNITITRPLGASGFANNHNLMLSAAAIPADNMQNDGIKVHQGISPNGDGIADVLTIDGIEAYPNNKLTIIDRNGAPVFEASGYDNANKVFDGHSNKTGAMQRAGTYYYLLEYRDKDKLKRKTGYLIIKY